MKSLIKRIITQSGIEPSAWIQETTHEDFVYFPTDITKYTQEDKEERGMYPVYTESKVFEIAEKVAKAWAAEKAMDKVIAIGQEIGGYENE